MEPAIIQEDIPFPVRDVMPEKLETLYYQNSPNQISLDGDTYLTAVVNVRANVIFPWSVTDYKAWWINSTTGWGTSEIKEIHQSTVYGVTGDSGYSMKFVINLSPGQNDLTFVSDWNPAHATWETLVHLTDRVRN